MVFMPDDYFPVVGAKRFANTNTRGSPLVALRRLIWDEFVDLERFEAALTAIP